MRLTVRGWIVLVAVGVIIGVLVPWDAVLPWGVR